MQWQKKLDGVLDNNFTRKFSDEDVESAERYPEEPEEELEMADSDDYYKNMIARRRASDMYQLAALRRNEGHGRK